MLYKHMYMYNYILTTIIALATISTIPCQNITCFNDGLGINMAIIPACDDDRPPSDDMILGNSRALNNKQLKNEEA